MKRTGLLIAAACAFLMNGQSLPRAGTPKTSASVISVEQLPKQFAVARTFHYPRSTSNPESLLTILWKARLRVSQAWLPLDNQCMGPVGPQFTVELAARDARILKFGFVTGDGRLRCATMLKRFVLSN